MKRIAVLGLGLIGGSLGLAMNKRGLVEQIHGYDTGMDTTVRARKLGAITHICSSPEEAVESADLVILATPVLAMHTLLERIAPRLKSGALVTDTASTKAEVVSWAGNLLPQEAVFVGGHPMAGRERSGIEVADATLFDGCTYCLTPTSQVPAEAVARLSEFVRQLGAQPMLLDAKQHDHLVAGISHLPFVLSSVLVQMLGRDEAWSTMTKLAAGGFRHMSRLAAGSPVMYRDICITNKDALLGWLESLAVELDSLRSLIAADPEALEPYFERARQVQTAQTACK